jgi:hypothetical protein
MAKKNCKKLKKAKLPDLMKVMDNFQEAHSILKCGFRCLKQRCDPSGEPWISVQVLSDGLALHGLRARHSNPLRSTRGYARDLAVARRLPRQ